MRRTHRRQLLKSVAAAAIGVQIVPAFVLGGPGKKSPSEKLNIAGIGIGGQGASDLKEMAGENIVALCDCDWTKAGGTFKSYPKAQKFKDYRLMLDQIGKEIDAIMVATPDHMHAPIALHYMRAQKHAYVEKPMAHTIEEARLMTKVAKEMGVVTQMGNNGHAGEGLRLTREWLDAGAIGVVKEIHCWSDRPGKFWKQDLDRPAETPPVPANLEWDLFLGAAPERPYHPVYHPRAWRGWFDYGTGALGDMAVHNMDPAFYALDLGAPIAAEAQTSPIRKESYPAWQIIKYEFAAKGNRPAVNMTWYDGGKMPEVPAHVKGEYELKDNGILFIGDKGTMVCGGWSGPPAIFPGSLRKDFAKPAPTIARSPLGHRGEWIQACKDSKPQDAKAGFDYSGPFTEALLVGNLAVRLQKRVEWDSANMKCTNLPEPEGLVKKTYRKGFGIS